MSEEHKKFGGKHIFQTLVLLLFLVVLPLGSWYYLRTGLDYRLEALEELQDYGRVSGISYATYQSDTLVEEDLLGRLVVAGFVDLEDEELASSLGRHLRRVQQQFEDRPDVLFLVHVLNEAGPGQVSVFEAEYGLKDEEQCIFIPFGSPEKAKEIYFLPEEAGGTASGRTPYLALIDTALTIRHYYDVRRAEEVRRLIEHIAILLPPEPEKDLVFRRETEK